MVKIESYLEIRGKLIEQQLDQLIPPRHSPYQALFEAARYSLLGRGKRLRPIITLATTEMLGGDIHQALLPACALELIHTYSFIHDDLPCMDDDDFRRGHLTVHKKYSEGLAVLTGDYLLTYAFELLATAPNLQPDKKVKLVSTLAKRSGGDGMIGGQVMDISLEGKPISLELLRQLHRQKTAALITAAVEFAGIIANANEKQMEHLRNFGENIGLAFQVIDDVLDVTSSTSKHGRPSDLLNDKATYVTLLGLEQAKASAHHYYDQAIRALKAFPFDVSMLIKLADFMIQRHH